MSHQRRITVLHRVSQMGGVLVTVPDTRLQDLYDKLQKCLDSQIKVTNLYTTSGARICDLEAIRDNEVLYVEPEEQDNTNSIEDKKQSKDNMGHGFNHVTSHFGEWIHLNVGGQQFMTTRETLTEKYPDTMLARMFSCTDGLSWQSKADETGAYLIDRSPVYFEPVLNYLRHGQLIIDKGVNPQGVLEEAKFFGILPLIEQLEAAVQDDQPITDGTPLTRRDLIFKIMGTETGKELRCQGLNFTGANLSKLDLRNINFKYGIFKGADLSGANLSCCNFERADLSGAKLDGANLLGVKMLCVNLEGASMCVANLEDPAGTRANMEGANMKHINMEGSQMSGVNLRVATLKNANLQNCDLRGAVLAGADLENCNLSGCDLQEANLRGANLKGAAFELMLNPLHMAQTVR
ncbi:hypothetical protein LSH36_197g01010 [Paralvinella palmiformis]|uniref:BTB domain-containing protein n=1 Tax=Paralvinella palmiformis TaxID=53620 RepID=A0AAD9JR73_9ANNE|nr:hypothetical protein LSH36_197g01010 [Paralvinella palmiformis]